MKTKKLTYGGLLLAIGILLPQAFHLTGVPQSGAVFLPMHIPVLLAGFLLGPAYGVTIGIILPIISFFLTGMPALARLPFMVGELLTYGLFCGLCYYTWNFSRKKFGIYSSLVVALIAGRVVYGIMILIATYLLKIPCGGLMAVVTAIITGIYGIVIQLLLIPGIVFTLKKGGFLNDLS